MSKRKTAMEFASNGPMTLLLGLASSLAKYMALILLWFMCEADILDFSLRVKLFLPKFKEDQEDGDSDWDVVSGGSKAPSPASPGACSANTSYTSQCEHSQVSKKGSNHFVQQRRCKICGLILFKELTRAGVMWQDVKAAKKGVLH